VFSDCLFSYFHAGTFQNGVKDLLAYEAIKFRWTGVMEYNKLETGEGGKVKLSLCHRTNPRLSNEVVNFALQDVNG